MSCILKLSVAKTPSGGEVYLVDPDRLAAARADRRFSRNPRERAAAEAEEILADARARADKMCLEALERGYKEGSEQSVAEYADARRKIEELTEDLRAERESFFAEIEPKVVKLSVEIAEKILRRELTAKPESVLEIAKAALYQLMDTESVRLCVNPEDVELIKANQDDLGARRVEIIEDRRVEAGGCVVESPNGRLDARISTQISQVAKLFAEEASDTPNPDAGSDEIQQDS